MVWIHLCFHNLSVIFTVTLCYVLHQTHSEFWHISLHIHSCQRYLGIFKYIETSLRHMQVYLGVFSTLSNPHIFTILKAYIKLCETMTRHIQKPATEHYSAIFKDMQNLLKRLHMQKPGIFRILEYSELFHNCIPTHIQNPVIFTKIYEYSELWQSMTYSEPSQKFKMEFFWENS